MNNMSSEKLVFSLFHPHGPSDVFFCWQRGSGGYLATTGYNQVVSIYDRHGELVEQIRLPGMCTGFGWDADGDILGMITDKSPYLLLWDANTGKGHQMDTGLRDAMSCIIWAKGGPLVAVATSRGNLMIYNHKSAKRIPILGKHTKRITCGAWSKENLLALGSEDKTMTINNVEGDTLRVINLRADPSDIQFSEMKLDERVMGENTVSVLIGKKTLFLYNMHDPENPIELAFQARYGSVVTYKWFGDGYILLGFNAGYFVGISTHMKEIGQELFQVKNYRDSVTDIALSTALGKAASCGDNTVKFHEMGNLQDTSNVLTLEEERGVDRMAWSDDGQLLAVGTAGGSVHVFLTKLPLISSVHGTKIALLTSLMEITIYQPTEREPSITITTEVEPSFIAVGPYHFASGMNNRAWLYGLGENGADFIKDKEYLGTIKSMLLNSDYASVLYEGKIQLHMIEGEAVDSEERETKIFPDTEGQEISINCHALTQDFLIYGTDMGSIFYFFIEDWKMINEYRHSVGIRELYAEASGSRLAIIDDKSEGYLYNPVNDQMVKIPDFPPKAIGILWENWPIDRNIFIAYDENEITTYVYVKDSLEGTSVEKVGSTKIPLGQMPLLLYNGEVTLQTPSGKLANLVLGSHEVGPKIQDPKPGNRQGTLMKHLALRRFKDAWSICQVLNTKDTWIKLADAAMKDLNVDLATRVYRHIGDVGMVWSLESIHDIEDKKLLAGHIAMFMKDFEKAQEWYLMSSQPSAALDMRRDLLQWDQALQLARKLAPDQIPYISREYGQQLEFTGSYQEALSHYESGIITPTTASSEDHNASCKAGIARTALRCGDVRRGVSLASESNSRILKKECAEILEGMKQYSDAAMLYEKGSYYDKSASLYIRLKNWQKVGDLLPNITSPKIHIQYAKAKEADGKYKEAVKAYETARDYDNVIRINLDHLNNPEDAVQVVKETRSIEGAKMVAKFFQKLSDYTSAIQFLVLSHCIDEAFQLARQHGKMELYGDILGRDADPEDYRSVAVHFEGEKNSHLAGKYYYYAGDHFKALKHLLRAAKSNTEDTESLQLAIDVVGASNDDQLANQVIEYLMGETDGVPKDPKYLFRLYMARRQYREAAKTAIIIANEEQNAGNYRNAHDVLFGMYQELKKQHIKIPKEMEENLTLLHSYILVRLHVRRQDHMKGARMLIRVANNISKFPSHIVPILTSTVIECHRAGLKSSSFSYAAMLMRPEYRTKVDPKYKKKIEAVVRKPSRVEEEEPNTPCPYCNFELAETELNCSQCKNFIPFCIATGRHIVKEDLTACPSCDFPAIASEFRLIVEVGEPCPMCGEKVQSENVRQIQNAKPYLFPEGEE